MTLTLSRSRTAGIPGEVKRSISIRNVDAMNETEARAYAAFCQEGRWQYEESAVTARTILYCMVVLIVTFGAFYLYYARKY